jgi:hypothetical protein
MEGIQSYSLGDPPVLLGGLHYIFQTCERNIMIPKQEWKFD